MTAENPLTDLLSAPLSPDWTIEGLAERLLCTIASQPKEDEKKLVLDLASAVDRQTQRVLRPLLACLATKSAAEVGAPPNLYGGLLSFKRIGPDGPVWIFGEYENKPGSVRIAFQRSSAPPDLSERGTPASSEPSHEAGKRRRSRSSKQASDRLLKLLSKAKELALDCVAPVEGPLPIGTLPDANRDDAVAAGPSEPDDFAASFERGKKSHKAGAHSQAIAHYTAAIRIDPTFAEVYNRRGNAYLDQGDASAAIADYSRAIRLDPDDAILYYNRGKAHEAKGAHSAAIADFTEAIRIDPQFTKAHIRRSKAYNALGR